MSSLKDGLTSLEVNTTSTGKVVQFGTVTPSGGITADAIVTFGENFLSAPTSITITPLGSLAAGLGPYVTGIAAGSFTMRGGSNISHAWIAIG